MSVFAGSMLLALAVASTSTATQTAETAETVPLPVTWRVSTEVLTPAEATGADLDGWALIDVSDIPREGPLSGHHGLVWYGLDVPLPPAAAEGRAAWSLLLPPFRVSYEVHAGGQHLGTSGSLFPEVRAGPIRHLAYDLPPGAIDEDGRLRIRVRAFHTGSKGIVHPDLIAVGGRAQIQRLEELALLRSVSHPERVAGRALAAFLLAVAAIYLLLFAMIRRQRVYGWFALALIALAVNTIHMAAIRSGQLPPDPLNSAANGFNIMVAVIALIRSIQLIFGAPRWTIAATYVAGVALFLGSLTSQRSMVSTVVLLLVSVLGIWIVGRGWRARDPDAGIFFVGMLLTASLFLVRYVARIMFPGLVYADGLGLLVRLPVLLAPVTFVLTVVLTLTRRFRRSIEDLARAHRASLRFVPIDFLALLGRTDVVEVQRGDSVMLPMTVLFSDIRGFTKMSEDRSPEDNFAFINAYLERMEPCITGNGGFINQYYGDGILAMFRDPDDAVRAAIAMRAAVDRFSRELQARGEPGLDAGVGLHTGSLMLGAIGGRTRLDTGVIGDAVNLAARVEGMTKQYRCRTLLSGATVRALRDPKAYGLRVVDTVRAVGRSGVLELHQLLDTEDAGVRERMASALSEFARGLQAYRKGTFEAARAAFSTVLEQVDDGPSLLLLARCEARIAAPPPNWDGVTELSAK